MLHLNNFNKNLQQFISNIISNYPSMDKDINNIYKFPTEDEIYILDFLKNTDNMGFDISTKNEIIFSENNKILNAIDFYKIWNDESLEDFDKDIIWKYLHVLYLHAFSYKTNLDIKDIKNKYKNLELDSPELDERTKAVLNILEFMKYDFTKNSEIDTIEIDEDIDKNDILPNFGSGMPNMNGLLDGEIGNLAKEIVKDIDTSNIKLDNPDQLLKGLLNGNLEGTEDSGLKDLIGTVVSKLENKMSSGDINEQKLFNEANSMMGKLGLSKNMFDESDNDNDNDNSINNIFNNLKEDFDKDGGFKDFVNNMSNNENNGEFMDFIKNINLNPKDSSNKQKIELEKRRDILRKKLDKKKKKKLLKKNNFKNNI